MRNNKLIEALKNRTEPQKSLIEHQMAPQNVFSMVDKDQIIPPEPADARMLRILLSQMNKAKEVFPPGEDNKLCILLENKELKEKFVIEVENDIAKSLEHFSDKPFSSDQNVYSACHPALLTRNSYVSNRMFQWSVDYPIFCFQSLILRPVTHRNPKYESENLTQGETVSLLKQDGVSLITKNGNVLYAFWRIEPHINKTSFQAKQTKLMQKYFRGNPTQHDAFYDFPVAPFYCGYGDIISPVEILYCDADATFNDEIIK